MKEAKAAAKKAVEDVESSGGGMSLMDDLAPIDGAGGGDSGALADELDKMQNRLVALVSKVDHQKEMKVLKSTLTRELDRTNEKIDEVCLCLRPPSCKSPQRLFTDVRLTATGTRVYFWGR